MNKIFLKNSQNGFSFIEMVLVLVLAGLMILVTAGLLGSQTELFTTIFNRSILNSEGRKAIDRLRIDLHNLSPDSIAIMQNNQLSFKDMKGNTLIYQYVSSEIQRNSVTILRNVQSAPFAYFDSAMVSASNPSELVYVKVNLNLTLNTKTVQLEELFYARN